MSFKKKTWSPLGLKKPVSTFKIWRNTKSWSPKKILRDSRPIEIFHVATRVTCAPSVHNLGRKKKNIRNLLVRTWITDGWRDSDLLMEKYEVFLFHHFLGIISGTKCVFSDWGWCAFAAWRQIGDDAWVTGSHFSRISCEIPAPWWLGMGVRCCNKKRGECWRSKLKATKWKEVYNYIYICTWVYI